MNDVLLVVSVKYSYVERIKVRSSLCAFTASVIVPLYRMEDFNNFEFARKCLSITDSQERHFLLHQ